MTREQHPITPPSELMQQWWDGTHGALYEFEAVVTQAARWGADQELKECCKAIADQIITVDNIGLSGPAGVLHTKAFSSWPTFAQMVSRQLHAARRPEPEPEAPTDEEIMELMPQQMRDDLAAAARALAGFDPDNIKAASVFRIILNRHFVDHSRVVLARWGNHPASPDSSTQPS